MVVQVEADAEQLAARLRRRGTSADDVAARLVDNEREAARGRSVADVVVRNDAGIDDLVDRLALVVSGVVATGAAA